MAVTRYVLICCLIVISCCVNACAKEKAPIVIDITADALVIRESILAYLPLGVSVDRTVEWLSEHGFKHKIQETGFPKFASDGYKVVGVRSIRAALGERKVKILFTQSVVVDFGYDKNNRLIDVWVSKTTDAF